MEKISEINFFYIGIQEKESKKFDYYDLIKPGVAVLFGENKNYIIYYQINQKTVQSTSFEEISIEEDLLSQITKLLANNKISIERVIQIPDHKKKSASIVIITHRATESSSQNLINSLKKNKNIIKKPVQIRLF